MEETQSMMWNVKVERNEREREREKPTVDANKTRQQLLT